MRADALVVWRQTASSQENSFSKKENEDFLPLRKCMFTSGWLICDKSGHTYSSSYYRKGQINNFRKVFRLLQNKKWRHKTETKWKIHKFNSGQYCLSSEYRRNRKLTSFSMKNQSMIKNIFISKTRFRNQSIKNCYIKSSKIIFLANIISYFKYTIIGKEYVKICGMTSMIL